MVIIGRMPKKVFEITSQFKHLLKRFFGVVSLKCTLYDVNNQRRVIVSKSTSTRAFVRCP